MAQKANHAYNNALYASPPLATGSSKTAIESLQKQINFHFREILRLRSAQNSHTAVFRLPAELLAEVFRYITESGLQEGNTYFTTGTFNFLQVCNRWNEVAVSSPHLWGWWVSGAVKAWPVFHSRSKAVPLFLSWRSHLPTSARDILMDPTIPGRIRRLDFVGTLAQLVHLLGVFDLGPPTNVTSVRLESSSRNQKPPKELAFFLSSSFPKLSRIDLEHVLPNYSSPIFTTSSLTSLKLTFGFRTKDYTLSQLSQILQRHPNLRELGLTTDAMPPPGPSEPSLASFTLPQLGTLRLSGASADILGLIKLIGMSSPLHTVVLCFCHNPTLGLAGIVKEILVAYYECQGLNYSRKLDRLAISHNLERLTFDIRSRPIPTLNLRSNLKLQFLGVDKIIGDIVVEEAFSFFPLNDVQNFVVQGLGLNKYQYNEMFRKMENISHLQLIKLKHVGKVLNSLILERRAQPHRLIIPKLKSLTLSGIDLLHGSYLKLFDFLSRRRDRTARLKRLTVKSCRMYGDAYESELKGLVNVLEWVDVKSVGYEDLEDSESEDSDDFFDFFY